MYRGAQAAQAFHGEIVRVVDGEEFAFAFAVLDVSRECDFDIAVRNGGVHRQAKLLLDLVGVFHHDPEGSHHPDQDHAEQQPHQQ